MQSKQKQKRKTGNNGLLNQSLLNRKIVSPEKLKILVLAGNELINQQLQFLQKCVNLIKLDLSHNYITKVPEKIGFAHLKKLEVMHLHYNKLASIQSMHALYACPVLTYLTYHHNPIQNNAKYEHEIINMIFTLKLINNRIIYVEERSDCLLPERKTTIIDIELFQNWKSVQNSQAYYLRVLNLHLQYIDNVWAFNNPIVILQRFWKHFLSRQEQVQSVDSSIQAAVPHNNQNIRRNTQNTHRNKRQLMNNHPLKLCFHQWKAFSLNLKQVKQTMSKIKDKTNVIVDKSHMTLPLKKYAMWQKNKRLQQLIKSFVRHIRQVLYEKKMVKLFRTNINLKKILFGSQHAFYQLGGIRQNNRIYYNRSQQHIIDNFLAIIAESFNKRQVIYDKSSFQVNKQYKAIRLVDPQSFSNKYALGKSKFAFCSLLWTSMKLVIVNRKKIFNKFKAGIIGIKQLSYLKNRDKVLTPAQYKKSLQIFNRLQKFSVNEYEQSLWYFECTDEFVMRQLIRMIYYHNASALKFQVKKRRSQMMSLLQNYDQPFILYIEKVMKRTCAAVVIQKTWRRYLSGKSQKQSIYYLMKKNRAALHIQHFYRDSLYKHRLFFSKKLYRDLALIKSQTIIFPLDLYMNFNLIYHSKDQCALFKNIRITRDKDEIGMKEEFYRPIFQQKIRERYHGGKKLGIQNQEQEIDIYNLLHYNSQAKIVQRNLRQFISFTFSSKIQAATVASLIALLSYQKWGKVYIFPLLRQNLQNWQTQIDSYLHLRVLKNKIKPFNAKNEDLYLTQQVKENGLFLFKSSEKFIKKVQINGVGVDFYQKKYHNFPQKYVEKLFYSFINILEEPSVSTVNIQKTQKSKVKPNLQTVDINNQQSFSKINNNSINLIRTKHEVNKLEQNYLNVTTIDKKRFSFFDQSDKNINFNQTQKSNPTQFLKPTFLQEQNKKQKVKKFYKNEFVKRQAQKQLRETSLAGIREKAKHERSLNITIRNLKQMERTEQIRNKVNRVKNFKSRLSGQKRDEQEFMQQNNFVMQQQLRMIIMRNKIKQTENKQEDNHFSRKTSVQRPTEKHSVQSRHSGKHRIKVEQEELNSLVAMEKSTAVIVGNEGSIVNVRKKARKIRANSIGAYIRDPSFVHGVFPEEYYPIENRATSFYFPPVI